MIYFLDEPYRSSLFIYHDPKMHLLWNELTSLEICESLEKPKRNRVSVVEMGVVVVVILVEINGALLQNEFDLPLNPKREFKLSE